MITDPILHPAHYEVYPVQPIEITRYLGFCLGNAVKYVLRAPYKGGVEDCDKSLRYLELEHYVSLPPLTYQSYCRLESGLHRLQTWLDSTDGDPLWRDISEYQRDFLRAVEDYVWALEFPGPKSCHFQKMRAYVRELSRVLGLRDTTGQIYEGMSGLPCKKSETA